MNGVEHGAAGAPFLSLAQEKMKKALATLLFQISRADWQLPFGKEILKELKELGFEAHNISHYGCYCRFGGTKYAPEGEAQDEYDRACFNYSQCVKCLDLDQCKIHYPRYSSLIFFI